MRGTWAFGVLVLAVLLACKDNKSSAPAKAEPAVPAAPAPTAAQEKIEDFSGSYRTNWGTAKCTQVKKNVNCLYAGKSGSIDCKVTGEKTIECDWEEGGESGKTRLTKQDDGKLKGPWGSGNSFTNGGVWIFTPIK